MFVDFMLTSEAFAFVFVSLVSVAKFGEQNTHKKYRQSNK